MQVLSCSLLNMLDVNVSPEMKFGEADFCKDTSAYDVADV